MREPHWYQSNQPLQCAVLSLRPSQPHEFVFWLISKLAWTEFGGEGVGCLLLLCTAGVQQLPALTGTKGRGRQDQVSPSIGRVAVQAVAHGLKATAAELWAAARSHRRLLLPWHRESCEPGAVTSAPPDTQRVVSSALCQNWASCDILALHVASRLLSESPQNSWWARDGDEQGEAEAAGDSARVLCQCCAELSPFLFPFGALCFVPPRCPRACRS